MSERSSTLDEAFDVENEEGTPPLTLLPPGKYAAEVVDAYVAPTKNGRGQMVHLRWTIVEGDFENRLIFQSCIIQHDSADAQKFGRQKFRDVCFSCGITGPVTDLEVLKYKKCHVRVGIEQDKTGQYPDKNKVTRVDPYVAPWNGPRPAADVIREASEPKPGFKTANDPMNDAVPF
jgi:Protein of unknown function (DUF669)